MRRCRDTTADVTTDRKVDVSRLRDVFTSLWLFVVAFFAPLSYAFEPIENLQVHGFLTQGYFLTSNHKIFGNSDRGGSLNFTEIGLNGSWELSPKLRIAAQLLSRRAGKGNDGDIDLDFGLLDYTAADNENYKTGVRVGRVRLPYGGFWNDTRDVAFARPSILLPQSIYPDTIRSYTISGDGIETYANLYTHWGDFQIQFVGAYPRTDDRESEAAFLGQEFSGELHGRPSFYGRVMYDYGNGLVKLAISGAQSHSKFSPRPADRLLAGETTLAPIVFSAQLNTERWSFTAEYRRQLFINEGYADTNHPVNGPIDKVLVEQDAVGESYYAQLAYRPTRNWEAVVRYDVYYNNMDDRSGRRFRNDVQTTTEKFDPPGLNVPAHNTFAKDWMVGLRYDITKDLMVRAEYHRVFGTGTISLIDNPIPNVSSSADFNAITAQDKANWDIFAILFSYRF